jgi:hypothetical protein
MAVFFFLALVAVVLGIVGAVADGLGYLLIIGIVVLVADIALAAVRWTRHSHRRPLR